MTAAIPPGQRHIESLHVPHSWTPFLQLSGRLLLMILRKAWERMRKSVTSLMICETGPFAGGVLDMDCLILLLHISVNHWSLVRHDLPPLLPPSGPQLAPKQNVTSWTIKATEPTPFALRLLVTIAVAGLYRYRLYTLHSLSKQILPRSFPSIASGLLVIHEHH